MLGSANAPAPWGGESDPTASIGTGQSDRGFLGMRYALACWLDEILIDAGWREWDENKLESALYRTNIRYSNFWNQARLADAIPWASTRPGSLRVPASCSASAARWASNSDKLANGCRRRTSAARARGRPKPPQKPNHGRAAAFPSAYLPQSLL